MQKINYYSKNCFLLGGRISTSYKFFTGRQSKSNHYQNVFVGNHKRVGKETGETSLVERWNNTLRQRLGRLVRKTLSFSKTEENH